MAKGAEIIVTSNPKGTFDECILDGAYYPGMLLEMTPNSAFVQGRPHMRIRSAAAGAKGPICVLLPDSLQGKLATSVYVSGTRGFVYYPVAGEDLNLLLGDVGGTGDIVTQGDLFGATTTGKIIANSAYTSAPFQAMESLAALTADTLLWVKYLGNQA